MAATKPETFRVKVQSRTSSSTYFFYDNVVSVSSVVTKDMGACRRLMLDNGIAIDVWSPDWKVLKLEWTEV